MQETSTWRSDGGDGGLATLGLGCLTAAAVEIVYFGWTTWASKEARNEAWNKVESDPRMKPGASPMPFDGNPMIYGGFEMISKV